MKEEKQQQQQQQEERNYDSPNFEVGGDIFSSKIFSRVAVIIPMILMVKIINQDSRLNM